MNLSVDGAVRNMYSLIAQCEELDKTMKPIYKLASKMYVSLQLMCLVMLPGSKFFVYDLLNNESKFEKRSSNKTICIVVYTHSFTQ